MQGNAINRSVLLENQIDQLKIVEEKMPVNVNTEFIECSICYENFDQEGTSARIPMMLPCN